ncbi:hypothetical protein FHR81_003597 [Actinoalloteichus hoggarensis]|nr:hypothetical protein [Actinoalloteichus hoggarensis]MBB5922540.1 hypothetical protein [Actinoalloteichus hoggarensis]
MRKRITSLIGSVSAAVVLLGGTAPAPVPEVQAQAPTRLTEISAAPYSLAENGGFETYAARIASLNDRLATADVADVLADANRAGRPLCHGTGVSGATGFCWATGDDNTPDWYPQGLTASWDASESGTYAGKRVMLASWYDASGDRGVRISFVDYDDPADVRYRHVLLVEPTSNTNFRAVNIHAGGVAWVGDHLYVMDTGRGIRVFDLRTLWRTAGDPTKARIGLVDGEYYAHDYRYVLPQVGGYTQTGTCSRPVSSVTAPLCFSYGAVDRSTSPVTIVTGEYYDGIAGARLVRWPVAGNGLAVDSSGVVAAAAAYQSPHTNLQGVASYAGDFLVDRSRGSSTRGILYRSRVGGTATSSSLPIGPEDLTYQAEAGRVWTQSEYPRSRMVFSVPVSLG